MNELQEQYRLLDVPADVSLATLKQAYKDLVLVWHPDRFSDHPRLQKKAEEKLKCINLAYQELSARHRHGNAPNTQDTAAASPQHDRSAPKSRKPQDRHHRRKTYQSRQRAQQQTACHSQNCHSSISLGQANFIVSHFHFRAMQRTHGDRKYFKSGPFSLEINSRNRQVLLENLCDSINGFHPILLTIPCKASGLFTGAEAQDLITLFRQSQGSWA